MVVTLLAVHGRQCAGGAGDPEPARRAAAAGFAPPRALRDLGEVQALPGATAADVCVVVQPDLWRAFHDVSLWAALRIYEWSQFTERVSGKARGEAYATERPDNRLQLEWERNQVDLLMLEGAAFACPWPGARLAPGRYDLDQIVPVSVSPFHELWNLVPSNAAFGRNRKRARLPYEEAMTVATPRLITTYERYTGSDALAKARGTTSPCGSPGLTPARRRWSRRYDRW